MIPQKSYVTIGEPLPAFKSETLNGVMVFPREFTGRWLILIGHPDGCGEGCTRDFMELTRNYPLFRTQGAEIVVLTRSSQGAPHVLMERISAEMRREGFPWPSRDVPHLIGLADEDAALYGMSAVPHPPIGPVPHIVYFVDPESRVRGLMYYQNLTRQHLEQASRILRNLQDQTLPRPEPVLRADFQPIAAPRPSAPQDDFCVEWSFGGKGPDLHH